MFPKQLFIACLLLLGATLVEAHTLHFIVEDNEDGSVTVEVMYSDGSIGAFTQVRLEGSNRSLLWKGKTDADGLVTFPKPSVPYTIIVDGGPGHIAQKKGPVASK